ncbi:MAG: hypothetical protein CL940_11575 [Deltaproteobacteria bacterium]|nr:hypothetical protein [Deltaproteobacteria bacterium]|tara:strand:+ start:258 stop:1181 length:924 start_codon:yes stop_codon:yes gene_type:complete
MNRIVLLIVCLLMTPIVTGCSGTMRAVAANGTVDIMVAGKPSVDRETDIGLARVGAESNLALMAGLRETVPDNEDLLLLMAEGYGGYAFGFVEDDLDQLEDTDDLYDETLERAYGIYGKGVEAARAWLKLRHEDLPDVVSSTDGEADRALAAMTAEDVPGLFWLGNSWSSQVNLKQDDPAEVLSLGRIEMIMSRALELDETFFDGGPHLFFGVVKCSAGKQLNDETESAAKHFARAWEISKEKNLMVRALEARWLLKALGDREKLEEALQSIVDAEIDSPRHNLINTLAKRRAARWLDNLDALIPEL